MTVKFKLCFFIELKEIFNFQLLEVLGSSRKKLTVYCILLHDTSEPHWLSYNFLRKYISDVNTFLMKVL